METGQASMHAPHNVEALATSNASGCSSPASNGVSTAPIGPEYTHP